MLKAGVFLWLVNKNNDVLSSNKNLWLLLRLYRWWKSIFLFSNGSVEQKCGIYLAPLIEELVANMIKMINLLKEERDE